MSQAPWQSPSILFTLLGVFLAGAATGAVTMKLGFPAEKHRPPVSWNEAGREFSLQKFKKELDLTPEQTQEFERIIDDFMTYYQYAQATMEDVRATGKSKILRILREDQKEKFQRMMDPSHGKQ
jgi:Spy/CpxP family protein refolding chaperone